MGLRSASVFGAAAFSVVCGIRAICGLAFPQDFTLPAGTTLYLRLRDPVSTKTSHLRGLIAAQVVRELSAQSGVVVPLGAFARGQLAKLIPSSNPEDRARILLRFTRLELPGQPAVNLEAHLKEVENARETVLPNGTIQGLLASELPLSHLEKATGKIGGGESELEKLQQKALGRSDTSIELPAGADLEVVLDQPLTLPAQYRPSVAGSISADLHDALDRFLADAPLRAATKESKPGDPLNLLVIGSKAQIFQAFRDGGWSEAERKNAKSIWDTVRAVAADQGYHAAPVSQLYLYGHAEDLAFEKMLNTFMKRHHLRFWLTPLRTAAGREVWLGAATHDIGLDVHPGVVSHATDPDLDAERDKVGADLAVSGDVASEILLTRPNALHNGMTATGGPWRTDGRLCVIELKPE